MIRDLAVLRTRPAALTLAAALVVLVLAPPEVQGHAAAGAAALIAISGLAVSREIPHRRALWLVVATVLAVPMARAATAPGAAVGPIAVILVCAAAGIVASALPPPVRELDFWPSLIAFAGTIVGARAVWEATIGLEEMRIAAAGAASLVDRDLVLGRLEEGRAYAGFPTPAALGGFLVLALALTAGALASRSGRSRAVLVAAAIVQAAGLLASRSLTAAGALAVAVGLVALRSATSATAFRRLAITGGCAVVILAGAIALRGRAAVDVNLESGPWALRWGNVRAAAAMTADHPWLGVGPGGYGEAFPQYRAANDNTTRHAHSLPFDLVAELGLPIGILLTVVFLGTFLGPALRRPRGAVDAGAAVGLAAFAIQNLGDFTALLPSTLGIAAIVRGLHAHDRETQAAPSIAPVRAAFAIAVLIAGAVFGLDGLGAGSRREARTAFAAGDSVSALNAATRAVRRAPWNPDSRLYLAQILEHANDPRAVAEIERVVDLVPERPSALATRARLRARRGDLGGALGDLERAARLHPTDPEYARQRDELARQVGGALP